MTLDFVAKKIEEATLKMKAKDKLDQESASLLVIFWGFPLSSVTRLDYFWKVLVPNSRTKATKIPIW